MNLVYTKAKQNLLDARIDLNDGVVKAVLVDTTLYIVDDESDSSLADVPAGARIATSTLTNTSVTDGVFDADDLAFPLVASGRTVGAVVLYVDGGAEIDSPLIAFMDSGFPLATNGADITLAWDNGSHKIFSLNG